LRYVEISHLLETLHIRVSENNFAVSRHIQTNLNILNYPGNDPEPFAVVAGLTLRTNNEET
jgi:hypothetical protein